MYPIKSDEEWVNEILGILEKENTRVICATHHYPDDDAWIGLWLLKKFKNQNIEVAFVRSGESFVLPEGEDATVINVDTGRGEYDQHGKGLKRSCSAMLIAEKLGLTNDPGVKPLIEMAIATDNIEPRPYTDFHYLIEGYPREFATPQGPDWKEVQDNVFRGCNVLYNQGWAREKNRKLFQEKAIETILPNGIKIVTVFWYPGLAAQAFKKGATVVIWTKKVWGGKGMHVGIQRNLSADKLFFDNIALALMAAEKEARGEEIKNWYLGDQRSYILCGSRTHPLFPNECTKLTPSQIYGITAKVLAKIPKNAW